MNEEDKGKEYTNLSVQESVRQSLVGDPNGQRMAAEIFNELPADHPDSPYADEIKAMRRAGIID